MQVHRREWLITRKVTSARDIISVPRLYALSQLSWAPSTCITLYPCSMHIYTHIASAGTLALEPSSKNNARTFKSVVYNIYATVCYCCSASFDLFAPWATLNDDLYVELWNLVSLSCMDAVGQTSCTDFTEANRANGLLLSAADWWISLMAYYVCHGAICALLSIDFTKFHIRCTV